MAASGDDNASGVGRQQSGAPSHGRQQRRRTVRIASSADSGSASVNPEPPNARSHSGVSTSRSSQQPQQPQQPQHDQQTQPLTQDSSAAAAGFTHMFSSSPLTEEPSETVDDTAFSSSKHTRQLHRDSQAGVHRDSVTSSNGAPNARRRLTMHRKKVHDGHGTHYDADAHDNDRQVRSATTADADDEGGKSESSSGSGSSDDEDDGEMHHRHHHHGGDHATPIMPWKSVAHKIERIAVRHFGAAKVREVKRMMMTAAAANAAAVTSGAVRPSVYGFGNLPPADGAGDTAAASVAAVPSRRGAVLDATRTPNALLHQQQQGQGEQAVSRNRISVALGGLGGIDVGQRRPVLVMPQRRGRITGSSANLAIQDAIDAADEAMADAASPTSGLMGGLSSSGGHAAHGATSLNINIPHGCQLVRTMLHTKTTLKSVVYMPFGEVERFASADPQFAHIWRGPTHVLKVAIRQNKDTQPTSVTGLNRWLYIRKWRILIISTLHLELKILDAGLKVLSAIASPKPVISLEFVDAADEMVAGGVGSITIWRFVKGRSSSGGIYEFGDPRLVISDLQIDEWITFTAYDRTRDLLYAVYDNNVNIYNYRTGQRVEIMRNIHEHSISAVLLYEPLGFFITGSKDSVVRVWNQQNYLLYEFKDHSSTITGLCHVKSFGSMPSPYIFSCSLDGTIRMWNLENGRFVYKMDTQAECLGMDWMKDGHFYSFSSERINVWYLNRFYSTYTLVNSPVISLSRAHIQGLPARILAVASDGSVSLVSARTGERLITAFPVMADTMVVDGIYDISQDRVYILTTNGDITVFSSMSNPCTIVDEWRYIAQQEKMTSIQGVPVRVDVMNVPDHNDKPVTIFLLVGGTESGQIVCRDVRQHGKQECLVQAHTGSINSILVDPNGEHIFTASQDSTVKIWTIEYLDAPAGNSKPIENSYHGKTGGIAHLLLTPHTTINTTPIEGVPLHCSFSPAFRILAVAMENHSVRLFIIGSSKQIRQLKQHPRDENHTQSITKIAYYQTQNMCFFASAGADGTVKIWDALANTLMREMQFNEAVTSICFANARADLLVGLSDQIALVQIQDYLPAKQLLQLLERDWIDDVIESSTTFDATLDFWKLYREKIKPDGNMPLRWYSGSLEKTSRAATSQLDKFERDHVGYHGTDFMHLNEMLNPQVPSSSEAVQTRIEPLEAAIPPLDRNEIKPQKRRFFDEEEGDAKTVYQVPEMSFEALMAANERIRKRIDDVAEQRKTNSGSDPFSTFTPGGLDKRERPFDKTSPGQAVLDTASRTMEAAKDTVHTIVSREESPASDRPNSMLDKPRNQPLSREHVIEVLERARARKLAQEAADLERQRLADLKAQREHPERITHNQKMALRKGWIIDRMAKYGGAPNSVIAGDVEHLQDMVRQQRKRDQAEREKRIQDKLEAAELLRRRRRQRNDDGSPGTADSNGANDSKDDDDSDKDSDAKSQISIDLDTSEANSEEEMPPAGEGDAATAGEKSPKKTDKKKGKKAKGKPKKSVVAADAKAGGKTKKRAGKGPAQIHPRLRPPTPPTPPPEPVEEPVDPNAAAAVDGEDAGTETAGPSSDQSSDLVGTAQALDGSASTLASGSKASLESSSSLLSTKGSDRGATDGSVNDVGKNKQVGASTAGTSATNGFSNIRGINSPERELGAHISVLDGPAAGKPSGKQSDASRQGSVFHGRDQHPFNPKVMLPNQVRHAKPQRWRQMRGLNANHADGGHDETIMEDEGQGNGEDVSAADPNAAWEPVHHLEISKEIASKLSWDLFKTAYVSRDEWNPEQRVLDQLSSTTWFRGLGRKEVNITNLVESVFDVLKEGFWSERVQAAKALLYLFHTFEQDFTDPLNQIIHPQLDFMQDESWQVRTQIINNLASFQTYNEDIVFALVVALADKNPRVVDATINTLGMFGISSSYALRNAMIHFRMIVPPANERRGYYDPLDDLEARLKRAMEQEQCGLNDDILKWMYGIDKRVYGQPFPRPDSSVVTLCAHPPPAASKKSGRRRTYHSLLLGNGFGAMTAAAGFGMIGGARLGLRKPPAHLPPIPQYGPATGRRAGKTHGARAPHHGATIPMQPRTSARTIVVSRLVSPVPADASLAQQPPPQSHTQTPKLADGSQDGSQMQVQDMALDGQQQQPTADTLATQDSVADASSVHVSIADMVTAPVSAASSTPSINA
ncbi:hypothetical protein BC831DRAFT_418144 [Entophlyctis helioformis]|nr:hypothetical protein BC831DRAFT_418144 [Entophlyctis helioformis]